MPKRIHVRIEHVKPSRCKEEFLRRSKENDEIKHEAKLRGGEQAGPRMLVSFVSILINILKKLQWLQVLSTAQSASTDGLQHINLQNRSFGHHWTVSSDQVP